MIFEIIGILVCLAAACWMLVGAWGIWILSVGFSGRVNSEDGLVIGGLIITAVGLLFLVFHFLPWEITIESKQ